MSVRVLVVDDSRFYRRRVSEILSSDPSLEVVGTAKDGAEAVELTDSLRPDVITMDVDMPVMDGITATRRIMASSPTPILMFSSQTTTGARATLDALDAGAVDYIPKRLDDIAGHQDSAIATLCRRIHQLKSIKQCFETQKVTYQSPAKRVVKQELKKDINLRSYRILVIGTSTGGPVALQSILTQLPKNFPLPILLVQHMPGNFTPAFATRLDQLCQIKVKEAEKGETLQSGVAYVAPGGYQTTVTGSISAMRLLIEPAQIGQIYKPCIDMTYDSLSKLNATNRVLAVILTGMGSDGTQGAKSLKSGGATIWAQDAASSLVASMPSSVTEAGVVDRVLSLDEMCSVLAGSA
ncbi:MAG: chemotaxis response regulator protein-glutamate methylesterase [Gammaproteobacteria bacterium]|nr:chemotaxis response regulator protein-glutamate methylesterase [Gammaproteobacteria bacterium]